MICNALRLSLRLICQVSGLALVLAACATPAFAAPDLPGNPEIDPGYIGNALALLTGGLMLMKDLRRNK